METPNRPTAAPPSTMGVGARAAVLAVRGYQIAVSPVLHLVAGPGAGCRFHPSCSAYAVQSFGRHGVFRGGWLTAKRLCKCGPWHAGGIDEVPPAR